MRMLDKKGKFRFFRWKINIIDFLVVLFLICLIPMFYFGWKASKNVKAPEVIFEEVTLTKAEYDQMQARLDKLDVFLVENKRYRKHFKWELPLKEKGGILNR